MRTAPDYVGYDATIGKLEDLRIPTRDKHTQVHKLNKLTKKELREHWQWREKLQAVAEWCDLHGAELLVSFYPYQVAKIMHPDYRLVIYRKSKPRLHLHAVNEHSPIPSEAAKAIRAVNRIVS